MSSNHKNASGGQDFGPFFGSITLAKQQQYNQHFVTFFEKTSQLPTTMGFWYNDLDRG